FQAEDGIRDFHVTGVQTCALPIYEGEFRSSNKPLDRPGLSPTDPNSYQAKAHYMYQFAARYGSTKVDEGKLTLAPDQEKKSGLRSEERRVGKECRSRRYTDQ